SRREPRRLDHDGRAELSGCALRGCSVRVRRRARGGYAGVVHRLLRKTLRRFEHRRCSARPEYRNSRGSEFVGESQLQRAFRSNNDSIDALIARKRDERVDVECTYIEYSRELCNARIPRGGDKIERRIIALEPPGDRVFAAASADEENSGQVPVF